MKLYLQTNCIWDYYWPSACARLTDFPRLVFSAYTSVS